VKLAIVVLVQSLEHRLPSQEWVALEPGRIDKVFASAGGNDNQRQLAADDTPRCAAFLIEGDPGLEVDIVIDVDILADEQPRLANDPDDDMRVVQRTSFRGRATLARWRDHVPQPFTWTVEGYRVTLLVRTQPADSLRVSPTLPAPQQAVQQGGDVHAAVDPYSGGAHTNAMTTLDSTQRWLVQPGRYSGDCWHVAAAMIFDDRLRLLVPRAPVVPSRLHIQIHPDLVEGYLDLEIEIRSQLGIARTFCCAELVEGIRFLCAGSVEFRLSMWSAPSPIVVVCHQGEVAISAERANAVEPSFVKVSMEPMHTLSRADFDNGVDRHLADDHPSGTDYLALRIRSLGFDVSARDSEELEWDQSFAVDNFAALLRRHAKGKESAIEEPIRLLVGALAIPGWMATVAWPTWDVPRIKDVDGFKTQLRQALVAAMSDEQWLSGRRLRQLGPARVCARLQQRLQGFLLARLPHTTNFLLIKAFSDTNQEPIVDAAKALAKLYGELLERSGEVKSEYVLISNQFLYFYSDCGFIDRVVAWSIESTVPQQGRQIFSAGRNELGAQCGDVLCGMTFSATSVLMRAVERLGLQAVRAELKDRFLSRLTEQETNDIAKRVQAIGTRRCVLLNMRLGGYHPEHDVTDALYAQVKAAADALGLHLVRVGGPRDWRSDGSGHLNVYTAMPANFARQVDLRHTAYLWHLVSEMPNVVGIIGGMSGSLDIAAYMGVPTACWDIALADHAVADKVTTPAEMADRIRLRLSFPFMAIIVRAIRDRVVENKRIVKTRAPKGGSASKQEEPPEPKEKSTWVIEDPVDMPVIDNAALMLWLAGLNTIPVAEPAFAPGLAQLISGPFKEAFAAVLLDNPQVIRGLLL
jgi:hypothetical protein